MGTREAAAWENRLFDRFMDVLDGFKEVRLNRTRSDDLFKDVLEVSRTAANIKIRTQGEALKRVVFSQGSAYVLLGAMVFVVPAFSSDTLGPPSRRRQWPCCTLWRPVSDSCSPYPFLRQRTPQRTTSSS